MRVDADEGIVRQADGRITEIELSGNPTTWLDRLDDGTLVQGQAQRIHFDVAENVVTLSGSARLEHERGEYTGDELTYDLDTESLAGRATSEGNRVRVILEPEAVGEGAAEVLPDDPDAADATVEGQSDSATPADASDAEPEAEATEPIESPAAGPDGSDSAPEDPPALR